MVITPPHQGIRWCSKCFFLEELGQLCISQDSFWNWCVSLVTCKLGSSVLEKFPQPHHLGCWMFRFRSFIHSHHRQVLLLLIPCLCQVVITRAFLWHHLRPPHPPWYHNTLDPGWWPLSEGFAFQMGRILLSIPCTFAFIFADSAVSLVIKVWL